jgi:Secretion system C-terminal sorting domain
MMKKFTLITLCALFANFANAQTPWVKDSLVMGTTGQTNDVYYHLGNGLVKTESNANWIIALGTKAQTAGVFINSRNGVSCYNPHKTMSAWSTLSLADTMGAAIQFNTDSNYADGALNAGKDGSTFDFGFGTYNMTSHRVEGDSIFILKVGPNFIKFRVDSVYGPNNWAITIGGLSIPTPDTSLKFLKLPKFASSNFIYLNQVGLGIVDTAREPSNNTWDFVATKYTKLVPQGFGQRYTGILNNGKIISAQVLPVPVDVAAANYQSAAYSTSVNTIGADWKFFDLATNTYFMNDSTESYLVQSNDSMYYQIRFDSTSYAIGTTKIRFQKRRLTNPAAINQVNNIASSIGVYPNPASTEILLSLQSKESAEAIMSITDMSGKTIFTKSVRIAQGLNAWNIPTAALANGNYVVAINGNNIKAAQLFAKQ